MGQRKKDVTYHILHDTCNKNGTNEPVFKTQVASLAAQSVKNLLTMQETWVQSLGWEDPLEKGTATHSSILAWGILWTNLVGYSPWGHKEL